MDPYMMIMSALIGVAIMCLIFIFVEQSRRNKRNRRNKN